MADSPRRHPGYGDLAAEQEQILAEVMALPSNRGDHAYQVAARRARALGWPSRLMVSFYEEVAAYYLRRPARSARHAAYRHRMIARRRRG